MKKFILTIFLLTLFVPLFAEGEKYHLNLYGFYEESKDDNYLYTIKLKSKYDYNTKIYNVTSPKILNMEEYEEMLAHLIEATNTTIDKADIPLYYTQFTLIYKLRNENQDFEKYRMTDGYIDDLSLAIDLIKEHPYYKDKVVLPVKVELTKTTENEKDFLEKLEDFFNPDKNPPIAVLYFVLFITFVIVYPIQLLIVLVGLIFHLFKQKRTVKYLLFPYGFILVLKNMYKELK